MAPPQKILSLLDSKRQSKTSEANIHEIQLDDISDLVTEIQYTSEKNVDLNNYSHKKYHIVDSLEELNRTLKHKGTKKRVTWVINYPGK